MLFEGLKTTVDLKDLGELDPALEGICSPLYGPSVVSRYLHRQFLEDAGDYLDRYQATDYWKGLLTQARRLYTLPGKDAGPRILDLGSGGGNTVLPLLELYPDAELVASDLSLPLLRSLRDALAERQPADRHRVLQQNAERLVFAASQLDLVDGRLTPELRQELLIEGAVILKKTPDEFLNLGSKGKTWDPRVRYLRAMEQGLSRWTTTCRPSSTATPVTPATSGTRSPTPSGGAISTGSSASRPFSSCSSS